jgi:hypothetical protein
VVSVGALEYATNQAGVGLLEPSGRGGRIRLCAAEHDLPRCNPYSERLIMRLGFVALVLCPVVAVGQTIRDSR